MKLRVSTDTSAGKAMATRVGDGEVRQLEASQLRARVQFLTQENEDLAQRNEEVLTRSADAFIISYLICVLYILCSGLTE